MHLFVGTGVLKVYICAYIVCQALAQCLPKVAMLPGPKDLLENKQGLSSLTCPNFQHVESGRIIQNLDVGSFLFSVSTFLGTLVNLGTKLLLSEFQRKGRAQSSHDPPPSAKGCNRHSSHLEKTGKGRGRTARVKAGRLKDYYLWREPCPDLMVSGERGCFLSCKYTDSQSCTLKSCFKVVTLTHCLLLHYCITFLSLIKSKSFQRPKAVPPLSLKVIELGGQIGSGS